MASEPELQMVRRHIREGAAIVLRKTAIVAELTKAGHDSTMAESLLYVFETLQAQHVAHLGRIVERDGMRE